MEERLIGENEKKIFIESAVLSDAPAIAKAERACFDDAWSETAVLSHVQAKHTRTLVAKDEHGQLLGYISASLFAPEAEIYRVATMPTHRRCKIGSHLLRAFIDEAEKEGCESLFLEVRASNTAAKELYFSHGFVEIGQRKNYYNNPKEDALILQRKSERA